MVEYVKLLEWQMGAVIQQNCRKWCVQAEQVRGMHIFEANQVHWQQAAKQQAFQAESARDYDFAGDDTHGINLPIKSQACISGCSFSVYSDMLIAIVKEAGTSIVIVESHTHVSGCAKSFKDIIWYKDSQRRSY